MLRLLPADAVTEKTITLADKRTLAYTATAGTLALHDQAGEKIGAVFYTAYVAKGGNAATRPITFAFNGGPGAASAYLHLGLAGPRIVDFGPKGNDGATPKLVDNPDTWLAFTDLVMIDPLATGWSRTIKPDADDAVPPRAPRRRGDRQGDRALCRQQQPHESSPKYLLGESYGGFRAAKVARAMQSDQGLVRAGIVMVSPMLETTLQWAGAAPRSAPRCFLLRSPPPSSTAPGHATATPRWPRSSASRCTTIFPRSPARRRKASRAQIYGTIAKMTGLPRRGGEIARLCARPVSWRSFAARAGCQLLRRRLPDARPLPRKRGGAAATRCSTASRARCPARSPATRATSSASRPR